MRLRGAAALAGLALAGFAARAGAQEPRAGLVVQLPDGTVREACLALPEGRITGLDLLALAGFEVTAEVNALGATVCAIDGRGCSYPAEPCWCQCRSLGADCTYWAYHNASGGGWRYSTLGAQARVVRDGDVDGWAWGPGQEGSGAAPPYRAFADLCRAAGVTPTESPGDDEPDPTDEPTTRAPDSGPGGEGGVADEPSAEPAGVATGRSEHPSDEGGAATSRGAPSAPTVEALATMLALAVGNTAAGAAGRLPSPGRGGTSSRAAATVPRIAVLETAGASDGVSSSTGAGASGPADSAPGDAKGYAVATGLLLVLAVVSWAVRRGQI